MREVVLALGDAEVWVDTEAHTYPSWTAGETVAAGDRRLHLGAAYACVQGHTTQPGWEPPVEPALWTPVREPFAPWVQPTGAQDAYPSGALVEHGGQFWQSDRKANVWEPGTFDAGWSVADDHPRVTRLGVDGTASARVAGGQVDVALPTEGDVAMPGDRSGWPSPDGMTVTARWPVG